MKPATHDWVRCAEEDFDVATDYKVYVDGKPRYQGVRDFLKSRGIVLPEGTPSDPSDAETVCGLGNRKNDLVNERLASGVEAYPGSVAFLKSLRGSGFKTAIVTSSQNCQAVLTAAGVSDLFDARVDGNVIAQQRLAGKPAPDSFLKAAEMLRVKPDRPVSVAKVMAGEAAIANGKAATQVFGGMGFTWEVDVHLYLKRAWVLDTHFHPARVHCELIAER